jgi:hypothetical protein
VNGAATSPVIKLVDGAIVSPAPRKSLIVKSSLPGKLDTGIVLFVSTNLERIK